MQTFARLIMGNKLRLPRNCEWESKAPTRPSSACYKISVILGLTVVTVGVFSFFIHTESDRTKENAWFTRLGAPLPLHKNNGAISSRWYGCNAIMRTCRRVHFLQMCRIQRIISSILLLITLLARIYIENSWKRNGIFFSLFSYINSVIALSLRYFRRKLRVHSREWLWSDGEWCARRRARLRGSA